MLEVRSPFTRELIQTLPGTSSQEPESMLYCRSRRKRINAAIDGGAQCIHGGRRINDRTVAPTMLIEPPTDAQVSTQEIFGPVVCVYGYVDEQSPVDQAKRPARRIPGIECLQMISIAQFA